MSSQPRRQGWILGLDLGIASVGWACLEHDGQGKPTGILAAGTHVFEAAVENGQAADQTPAAKRRAVRSQRRLLWRRRQRRRKTARLLQQAGLLPAGPMDTSEELGKLIKGLDADLAKRWSSRVPPSQRDRLVYHIRAAAAQGPVEPDELGRAIYHLAQRRGFKSNRRADRKADDKETGKVKEGINELRRLMHEAGARTLGAYFATVDPHERRIRNRYTHRAMYEEEFEAIWSAQQPHHAVLTPELHDALHDALFFQRPIRKQPGLVGMCSLVQGKRRAPKALRAYQRFRMLQGVNHLRIDEPGRSARPLTAEERKKVIEALEREGDLTFAKLRQKKLLALPKEVEFDLAQAQFDRGEDKKGDRKIIGHRTDAKLRKVLGDRFDALTEEEKDQLVHELRSIPTEEGLIRRATRHWHFTMEQAEQLADLQLEDGYAALSLTAINRLLPHLEQGLSYAEARKREFPESFKSEDALDALPPVDKAIDNLNNPSVRRAMRELRMVVNALIREHGKPGRIHIELARELKHSRSRRERADRRMQERAKQREAAAEAIIRETTARGIRIDKPSRDDIEKFLLAEECGWICPYTGRSIGWESLFGPHPEFDIEHIWPFSRSLDNRFLNKTLCHVATNRSVKKNRTPYEAFGHDTGRWEQILDRVRRFKGDPYARREKLRRFEAQEIDEGFLERHLRETSYFARLAQEYVGLLYGGVVDAEGKRRVIASSGGATHWLRRELGLDSILSDDEEKNRSDHRHHAVDAITTALLDSRTIQLLARAAQEAEERGSRRLFLSLQEEPWQGCRRDVEEAVARINVSHRQRRRVRGPLHEETNLSEPINGGHRVRKALASLSPAEIKSDRIVDPRARELIRRALEEHAGGEITKKTITQVFSDENNLPLVPGPGGRLVRIRHVRVEVRDKPTLFGRDASRRWANTGSNHHCVFYHIKDKDGVMKPKFDICTMAEAYRRVRNREPVVRRNYGEGAVFNFSLARNEYVEMDNDEGQRTLYRLLSISYSASGGPDISFALHTDAKPQKGKGGTVLRISSCGSFWKRNPRKVHVTYTGKIVNAGG